MNKKKKKVIIMGAGLAGLACAYELVKKNQEVIVLEKNDHVGGLTRTFVVDGFRFDIGPHRWFTKNEEINRWFKNLMEGELIRVPRLTRIYFDKKFFYYPMRLKNIVQLGVLIAFRAMIDYFWVRIKAKVKKPAIVSMEDAYIDQFGQTLYEKFFKNYSEKLWGRSCSQLSGDWVVQRSRGMSLLTIIKDLFFRSKGKVVSLVDSFLFPRLGIGRLAEKLRKEIEKKGGRIILGAEVIKINYQDKRVVSVKIKKENRREIIKADKFVSSIPLTELVRRMIPKVPEKIIKATNKLNYRSEVFVILLVKGTGFFPDNWLYVHPLEIPFMRFVETNNFSQKMSPSGKTSFVFEIPCNQNDKIWLKKDNQLVEIVVKSFISEFAVVKKADIIRGVVVRYAKTYPVYELGYQLPLRRIKEFICQFSNLQIIGRYGTFRYNNMDHSILTGIYAAKNIMGGTFDIDKINIEQEYLEEKKIK